MILFADAKPGPMPYLPKMVLCVILVLVVAAAATGWQRYRGRTTLAQNTSVQAKMVARSVTAPLAFEDTGDVTQLLNSLKAQPSVVLACVYTADGQIFAAYYRDKTPPREIKIISPQPQGSYFEDGYLKVYEPVTCDGQLVGSVCICSDI